MSQQGGGGMPQAVRGPQGMGGGKPGPGTSQFATQFRNANNVFDQSNSALGMGFEQTMRGLQYQPMMVQGQGYDPRMVQDQYSADQLGYDASMVSAANRGMYDYDPRMVSAGQYQAGQLSDTNLDPYMNPYEDQVVGQTLSDIDRARQLASNQTDAQATAMGAFGGSRQALMQAENNRNFLDQSARTSGQLRQQGFQNAQQMALRDIAGRDAASQFNLGNDLRAQLANQQADAAADQFAGGIAANQFMQAQLANQQAQDAASRFGNQSALQATLQSRLANQAAANNASQFGLQQNMQAQLANQNADANAARLRMAGAGQLGNLANLGFGMGQQVQGMLGQQGQYRRGIEQQLINAGRGQFNQFTGQPQSALGLLAQALGSTPYGQSTSRDPGLFDYLTLGATAMSGGLFS